MVLDRERTGGSAGRWLVLGAVLLAAGCARETARVIVQLRTDFVPGVEFVGVRTRFTVGDVTREATELAGLGDDFVGGQRIAELADVPTGTADVFVELLDVEGQVVGSRPLRASYDGGAHAFTVLISRSCRGVECPASGDPASATACVDGTCRDAACSEENPEACGDPQCASAVECGAGAACAEASCVAGRCLYGPASGACGSAEYCDPSSGCLSLPSADDAGTADAGVDAGATDSGVDAGVPDAGPPPLVLQPAANACADADAAGFVEVGRTTTGGSVYGLWSRPPYILVASTTQGLLSYTFDGSTFTRVDQVTGVGWAEAIWDDGTYFYLSAPGTGVSLFELGSDGRFTLHGGPYTEAAEARRAWGDGTYLYVPSGADGLVAFSRSGTTLTLAGSTTAVSFAQGAFVDAGTIYLADLALLRAYTFDGTTFSELDSVAMNRASRIWVVDGTLHAGDQDGMHAYDFIGGAFVPRAAAPTAAQVRGIWSDGAHVFAAAATAGVYALRYDGTAYSEVDQLDTAGESLGVVGDGTYVYVGDGPDGLKAYSGFACRRLR